MKNLPSVFLIFTLYLGLVSFGLEKGLPDFNFNKNAVIAHRGAWKNTGFPQNSIASLRGAIAIGCHGSELDVQLTADDSLVVNHDLIHHGLIIDSTNYADLIKTPLANGEKLSTLKEYLAEGIKQKQTKLIFDIKTPKNTERAIQIAEKAHRLVEQMDAGPWVEYLASDLKAAKFLLRKTKLPVAYLGIYQHELAEMKPENVQANKFTHVDYRDIYYKNNPDWVASFKKMGVHLNAWVIDQEADMNWFIDQEFDYITTDEPEILLKKLKTKLELDLEHD